jgi:predicted nucleotidyltransferase
MQSAEQIEAFRESWRPTPEKVDLAIKKAIEVARPSRVFVFGSWARGEAKQESDLDLAVFLPDDRGDELSQLRREIRRELDGIRMSVDLIVATEGCVSEFLSSVNSVYYKIIHDGRLVYVDGNR